MAMSPHICAIFLAALPLSASSMENPKDPKGEIIEFGICKIDGQDQVLQQEITVWGKGGVRAPG